MKELKKFLKYGIPEKQQHRTGAESWDIQVGFATKKKDDLPSEIPEILWS